MLEIGNDQKSPAAIEAATSHFCSCFALSILQQLGGATRHQGHKFCRYRYHSSPRSRRTARKPLDPDQRCRSTAAKSGAWHQDGFPISRLPGSPPSFSAWLCSPSPCYPLGERGRQDEQITGDSMPGGLAPLLLALAAMARGSAASP